MKKLKEHCTHCGKVIPKIESLYQFIHKYTDDKGRRCTKFLPMCEKCHKWYESIKRENKISPIAPINRGKDFKSWVPDE